VQNLTQREKNRIEYEKKFLSFIENLQDYEIAEKDFRYQNARQKVKIKHICCGTEWDVSISKFMNNGSRCPNVSCFTEKRVSHLRKEHVFFQKIQNDYELLDKDFVYTSKKERVWLKHKKCGHVFNPIIGNINRGLSICPKCKVDNRKDRTHEKVIGLFDKETEYVLLEENSQIKSEDKICVKHKKCGAVFYPTAHNFKDRSSRCPKCSGSGFSKAEKEVVEWLRGVYDGEIKENTRSVISPKELDIYLPEKNFAIEYNGLYWHSGERIDKRAHLDKTLACKEKEIKLFHIFSDEWEYKKDIVKSMILHRLGMSVGIVYARKCEVRKVEKEQGREFFEKCHISGDNRSSAYFGLFYGDKLRACLSLKKPIQKKYKNSIEIGRFATGLYTSVPGGFSKLFKAAKQWAKSNGYQNILTYADMRFGEGEVYNKEFKLVGSTPIDYWYTNGDKREFRFKYRASGGLTERQVAEESSVWPVYGCGSKIYLLSIT